MRRRAHTAQATLVIGIDGLHARLAPFSKLFSFEHHLRESQKDEEVARDAGGLLGLLWGMIGETIHAHVCACNMGNRVLCAGVASLVPLSIYTRPRARALSRVRACSVSLPPPHALGVRAGPPLLADGDGLVPQLEEELREGERLLPENAMALSEVQHSMHTTVDTAELFASSARAYSMRFSRQSARCSLPAVCATCCAPTHARVCAAAPPRMHSASRTWLCRA